MLVMWAQARRCCCAIAGLRYSKGLKRFLKRRLLGPGCQSPLDIIAFFQDRV